MHPSSLPVKSTHLLERLELDNVLVVLLGDNLAASSCHKMQPPPVSRHGASAQRQIAGLLWLDWVNAVTVAASAKVNACAICKGIACQAHARQGQSAKLKESAFKRHHDQV